MSRASLVKLAYSGIAVGRGSSQAIASSSRLRPVAIGGGTTSYSTRIPAGRGSRLPPRKGHEGGGQRRSLPEGESKQDGEHADGLAPSASAAGNAETLPVLGHATVVVPRNEEGQGVIDGDSDVRQGVEALLGQSSLVVTRQVEMLNVFMGYEQANRYAIVTPDGHQLGFLAESESGFLGGALRRQFLRTHRSFEAHIMDTQGRVVLTVKRPTTLINSRLKIYAGGHEDESMLVGEVHQVWHPLRRKYELFVNRRPEVDEETGGGSDDYMVQFASIDGGLLTWDFVMTDEHERPLGAITRNFRGFGREIFTDTGQYVLTFDPTDSPELRLEQPPSSSENRSTINSSSSGRELVTSGPARVLTMDERAVALATAVSVDFDYFSRHSHNHGSPGMAMFPWMWGGGGGGAAEPTPPAGNGGAVEPSPAGASTAPSQQAEGQGGTEAAGDGSSPSSSPWWEDSNGGQSQEVGGQDGGSGDSWGLEDPWQQGSPSAGGGGDSGWSWTDLFPGDD